jgi:hypothetical protein
MKETLSGRWNRSALRIDVSEIKILMRESAHWQPGVHGAMLRGAIAYSFSDHQCRMRSKHAQ